MGETFSHCPAVKNYNFHYTTIIYSKITLMEWAIGSEEGRIPPCFVLYIFSVLYTECETEVNFTQSPNTNVAFPNYCLLTSSHLWKAD